MALGTLKYDLRYGARMLLKQPGFTVAAILTLAIGIGACSAIFSVVNAVLLRPLPFPAPDRLVQLFETYPGGWGSISSANLHDWRQRNSVFEEIAGYTVRALNLDGGAYPERIRAAVVEPEFFEVLRLEPQLGRLIRPDEDLPGNDQVLLISDRFWKRSFGGDRSIEGRTVQLAGVPHTVIGVMPAGFDFPHKEVDVWVPLTARPDIAERRGSHSLLAIARLEPGVSVDRASEEMTTIARFIEQEHPAIQAGRGVRVTPLHEEIVSPVRPALYLLFGAVACVLLIACTNVANLLLARASTRRKELAIRAALGADRSRIVRQLLTESVLLSLLGGLAGLLTAYVGVRALVAWASWYLPRASEIGLDARAVAFTFGVSVLTGLAFGLAPALQTSQNDLPNALREGGGAGPSPQNSLLRSLLVIGETAAAVALLIGAGLLIKAFVQTLGTDPGLRPEHVLTFRVALADTEMERPDRIVAFQDALMLRLAEIPDVESTGAINLLPMQQYGNNGGVDVEGRPAWNPFSDPVVEVRSATSGYHRTVGVPLVAGRYFEPSDRADTEPVALVNEAFVRALLPGEEAIGRRVKAGGAWARIVGVVGDVQQAQLGRAPMPEITFPHTQRPSIDMSFVVRSPLSQPMLEPRIREALASIDPSLPVYQIQPLSTVIEHSVSGQKLVVLLMSAFAGVALLLAVIGIYSIMSYTVAQSTREIGLRVALGAEPRHVLALVLGHGLVLTVAGIVIGLLGAIALARLLEYLPSGARALDPMTYGIVSALLAVAAMVACFLPARRAVRVDPMVALRCD